MKNHTLLFAPLALTSMLLGADIAYAQTYTPSNRIPVADNTLGTQVSGNGNFSIAGGLQKGQTLFHSFSDFSLPTKGQANFVNPTGNRDIITRVTGNLFSDINGTINTQGANFFLINPHGMVFGPNVQLNVGKVFVGSTANSINLVDGGGRTITFGTNPNGDAPLLSVNPNVFFNVSSLNMGGGNGAISNFGRLQTNNNSQYIGLIGGNVTLNGSEGGGKIVAAGGRVDIGGLNSAGTATIDDRWLIFSGDGLKLSDVLLTNGAGITVRATGTLDTVHPFFNNATSNGSSINISANQLDILNSGGKLNDQPAALDAGLELNSGVQTAVAGDINIYATGKVNLNRSDIKNTLRAGAEGRIGDIKIEADALDLKNNSFLSSQTIGKGDAGNITVKVIGDINIFGYDRSLINPTGADVSGIISSSVGQGDAGKITIDAKGTLSIANQGTIQGIIGDDGIGNGRGIKIDVRALELDNFSIIYTDTYQTKRVEGKGNAGDINIKTTGDIKIAGSNLPSLLDPAISQGAVISSNSSGQGNTGKITIDTQGKLLLDNGAISSTISANGVGNGLGIYIAAREIELANSSAVSTGTFQKNSVDGTGDAGDINIKSTGDIKVSGYDLSAANPIKSDLSFIDSSTFGHGDTGKVTINVQGKLLLANGATIRSTIDKNGVGTSKGISVAAREIELANQGSISTATAQTKRVDGKGNAGDINIKTTEDIKLSGNLSVIDSNTYGQGDAGKITIDTQGKLSVVDRATIFSSIGVTSVGNGRGIFVNAREISLTNGGDIISSTFQTDAIAGTGTAGDINLNAKGAIDFNNSTIFTASTGIGQAGNISITGDKLRLNKSNILSVGSSVTGGNITIFTSDKLLMQNSSVIDAESLGSDRNTSGGNITISSPLIIASIGNNDIVANAYAGTGGKVNITSQGLFGIEYQPKGKDSLLTNDITASSTFGRDGSVNISTPGTDPGKDKGELKAAPNDATNQISQACSASQRDNKFYLIGRGGHPANSQDPLTSDVVWHDPRGAKSQPVANSTTKTTRKLASPAVGWVFDGKGKVTLVAARTEEIPSGKVICPKDGQ